MSLNCYSSAESACVNSHCSPSVSKVNSCKGNYTFKMSAFKIEKY